MFRKIKVRLVLLNTIVLFFVFCIFGLALYWYMHHIISSDINDKLKTMSDEIRTEGIERVISEHDQKRESEKDVFYILWGEGEHFIKVIPERAVFPSDLNDLKPSFYPIQTVVKRVINGHTYAVLVIPTNVHLEKTSSDTIKNFELVLNIDAETGMLNRLLFLIVFGGFMSLVVCIFAAIFLARRSLVPIQISWEKQAQFVADASHELRTPLSVIQTHLELLFRHPAHTIEQESEVIYKVLQETKRTNKLIADLLTLARSDSNQLLIERKSFLIDELVKTIVQQFEPIAELKKLTLSLEIEKDLLISGDQERLHQLFVILLDNAIKYNKENGMVTIQGKREGKYVLFTIRDTGIGIVPKDLPHIFDRFYRGDKSRNRAGGTGLGLSIAKWIVEAHDGTLHVTSKQNEGTSIIVKLPMYDTKPVTK